MTERLSDTARRLAALATLIALVGAVAFAIWRQSIEPAPPDDLAPAVVIDSALERVQDAKSARLVDSMARADRLEQERDVLAAENARLVAQRDELRLAHAELIATLRHDLDASSPDSVARRAAAVYRERASR